MNVGQGLLRTGTTKFWLLAMTLAVTLSLLGCEWKPKRISGPQFQQEYELRHQQTMHYADYLGEKNGKVCLRKKSMSVWNQRKWNGQLLYTEVAELDPQFLSELRKRGRSD